MNHKNGLSIHKSVSLLLIIALWVILFVLILSHSFSASDIYPTVWIFSSAILLMLLLLIRFKGSLQNDLSLRYCSLKWLPVSILVAIIFWLINSYLAGDFTADNEHIKLWQQGTERFDLLTVGLSSIVIAPIFEEMYFRGLLLNMLNKKAASWLAVFISALLFALIHWSWPAFVSLLAIGMIYGWMTLKSKSILPALLAHIINNALTFGLYSL